MRIGLLTFHRSINYGAFMQCYALSNELKKRYPNHTIEVIDFEYKRKHDSYFVATKNIVGLLGYKKMYKRFQENLSLLPLSNSTFITNDENSICEYIKRNYDIVIVGSDAVWTFQNRMPIDNPYWLFGDKLPSIIKMSYAASAFSTDFNLISSEERDIIKDRLSSFDYIGVRDSATKSFIDSLGLSKQVNINHDPTFFLEPSKDMQLARKTLKDNFVYSDKKMISFMTRKTPQMDDIRRLLYPSYSLLHFYRRERIKADLMDYRCRYLCNVSPYEWYNLYGQMSLNITQFFHGACIGIVNHVPTIVIDDFGGKYESKYAQVMNDLGLFDRLFYSKSFDFNKIVEAIQTCLNQPDKEMLRIKNAISIERKKSESFFVELDRVLK